MPISLLDNQHYSQVESFRDCTALKPLVYLRVQGSANNEIRITRRSASIGKSYNYLQNESQLLKENNGSSNPLERFKASRRNNRYCDNLPQRRKNKADRLRAFLIWLSEVEGKDGYYRCLVPDIFQYLPVNARYNGQRIQSERLTFISYPDGTLEGWDIETGKQIVDLNINEAKTRMQSLLVITDELQVSSDSPQNIGQDNRKTSFTRRARHTLLEAGQVIQNLCPSDVPSEYAANARAITLTLPGSTPEVIQALAAYSSWILNNLLQTVRDCEKPIYNFGVWELQNRGALHAHICIAAKPEDASMEFLEQLGNAIIDRWFQLLKVMASTRKISRGGKTGRLPGLDMFARSETAVKSRGGPDSWRDYPEKWRADNLPIKKNVAAYFSKYASKNASSGNKLKVFNSYCPSRWWFCSSTIRAEIKKWRFDYTVPYNPDESESELEQVLKAFPSSSQYSYSFRITQDNPNALEGDEPSRINVVNGLVYVYYWTPENFPEIWELFRDMKPIFAEVGHYRPPQNLAKSA